MAAYLLPITVCKMIAAGYQIIQLIAYLQPFQRLHVYFASQIFPQISSYFNTKTNVPPLPHTHKVSTKHEVELWFIFSDHKLTMLYSCTMFSENTRT